MQKESFVIKYRWPIIIGCLIVTIFMAIQLRHIKIDTDPQNLVPSTMSSRMDTKKIEDIFGPNDGLIVLLESDDVLAEKTLQRIKSISEDCHRIQGVKNVMSLFDTKKIIGENGAMTVSPAVGTIPSTQIGRDALRKDLLDNEMAHDVVVSKDFKLSAIMLSLKVDADKADVYNKTLAIIKKYPGDEKILTGGLPAFMTVIAHDVQRDNMILISAALIVMLIVLYSFFRQKRGVFLPFAVVLVSIIFGMALLPMFGWKLTLLSILLPLMVVAFSNNYGLYLIAKYRELCNSNENKTGKEIAVESLKALYKPILFTGIITIVGILGLLTHIMIPAKQIGIAAAIAIAFSLVVTLLGIPATLSLMKLPPASHNKEDFSWKFLNKIMRNMSQSIIHHPKKILTVTAVIGIIALGCALLVKVDSNQENMFSKKHPISQCSHLINKYLGGTQYISFLVQGDIKDPVVLNRIMSYEDSLKKLPGVAQASSMADVIRMMSKALLDKGDINYDRIPNSRNAVAQYLELYSMSGNPDDFERIVDFNYEKTQVIIGINDGSTKIVNTINKTMKGFAKNDTTIKAVGGQAVIMNELADTLIKGQIDSIVCAFVAIFILVIILFRSFSAGLLASIPLGVSLILGFGVMGISGINLDIATAIISSIVMGTGVDFTIQFLWKYRSARQGGLDYGESIINTLTTTGRAIAFNAICVVSGFGVLIFSSMPPMKHLAILFSVLTLACMAATLMVVPAICILWEPKFLEPKLKTKAL
jgi:hydrophobe/amphiphile efflux-3 (HAE3) family protein